MVSINPNRTKSPKQSARGVVQKPEPIYSQ